MDWTAPMRVALDEAAMAARSGDVPVGAVLLDSQGRIIARNHNRREANLDPTAHAEILVLREAGAKLGGWRVPDATLVVTLEPCAMCAGAIVLARIARLVIGTLDPKTGAVASLYQLANDSRLNHQVEVVAGVLQEEASQQLKNFFSERRKKN
ncbi:tRNA adenosine(34) deaminase TadA [Sulfobacillus harzensis]|uniref:tRNA-specific adenosine deaminase n=1 Tax=Sulfobacillus harzensis TaxID=2729629 RepID=A0A7Y0L8K8_9FIRM|nr:tRNA adenosine(34) deaminase TadA [Sulfobacillus harzensis]NMP24480.1 nucleoside deaminase [Sulfobacillus harzensis]